MLAAICTGLMFLFVLFAALWSVPFGHAPQQVDQNIGLAKTLGKVLFNEYLIPFEVTSVLFLSGMIGVVIFNKKETENE